MSLSMTKRSFALAAVVALTAAAGTGCSGKPAQQPQGGVRVTMKLAAGLVQTNVQAMTLTITDAGLAPTFSQIVQPMSQNTAGEWTGYVTAIPTDTSLAGVKRHFHIDAFDAAAAAIFRGDADQFVKQGGLAQVYLMLQPVTPPNQFGNQAPVIDVLTSSAATTAPGTLVNLGVTAHDPDVGVGPGAGIASYLWTSTCGTLAGAATATPTWTAPTGPDTTCTLAVTVTDSCAPLYQDGTPPPTACASSVTAQLQVKVETAKTGNAAITAYPNTCPVVASLNAVETFTYDANGKVAGYKADLTVFALDADADDLKYTWTSTCTGAAFGIVPAIETKNASGATFTSSDPLTACTIRVDVKDYWPSDIAPAGSGLPADRGCDNAATVGLSKPAGFQLAPVIVRTTQPNATASGATQVDPGKTYTFGADLTDPNGGVTNEFVGYPIQIAWDQATGAGAGTWISQSPGAPYQLASAGSASIQWKAPADVSSTMWVKLIVQNKLGLKAEHLFAIVPANVCVGAAAGTACNDGDPCTQTDTCDGAGACVGSNPVACTTPGTCQTLVGAACNKQTGSCDYPLAAPSTSCSDGNACTQNDVCSAAGACVPGPAINVCPGADQCHSVGTCAPATGCPAPVAVANGTLCNDANACTSGDACLAGVCAGTVDAAHLCNTPPTAACQSAGGTCNPATGACSYPAANTGATCGVANLCVSGQQCLADGSCSAGNQKVCPAPSSCDPVDGACKSLAPVAKVQTTEAPTLASPAALAYDVSGSVYQTGYIVAPGFNFGSGTITSAGNQDVYVAKLNPLTGRADVAGTWARSFGDAAKNQYGQSVAASGNGYVGVVGGFQGTLAMDTFSFTNGTTQFVDFVAGLNATTGAVVWMKQFNLNDPTGAGKLFSIASNPSQSAFAVCGIVVKKLASDFGASPVFTGVAGGLKDVVVAVLDAASGNVSWARQFGGTGNEDCSAVSIDDSGNVVISGSYTVPFSFGSHALPATGGSQFVYVAKLDATGTAQFASGFGLSGATTAAIRSLATDVNGNVAFSGQLIGSMTVGATALVPADPANPTPAAFVGYADASLTGKWAAQLFTPNALNGGNDGRAVAFDSFGRVYLTGIVDEGSGPTAGAAALTSAGSGDSYLLRLNADGTTDSAAIYGDFSPQEGWGLLVARSAVGAELNSVWMSGNYNGNITFSPLAQIVGNATVQKYLVKLK
jgi:hypothetical protein